MPSANVSRHVREAHCVAALKGATREAVILELSQVFVDSGVLNEAGRKTLIESVLKREDAGTTGIGNGVALPQAHARCKADHGRSGPVFAASAWVYMSVPVSRRHEAIGSSKISISLMKMFART